LEKEGMGKSFQEVRHQGDRFHKEGKRNAGFTSFLSCLLKTWNGEENFLSVPINVSREIKFA
jgi:hypothetical protein